MEKMPLRIGRTKKYRDIVIAWLANISQDFYIRIDQQKLLAGERRGRFRLRF